MTKKMIWRLKEQPTPKSLLELVASKILTNDEARQILFSLQEDSERDNESLKSEIKFLRELVQKLSNGNNPIIVERIREIEMPYYKKWDWYPQYQTWCQADGGVSGINCSDSGGSVAINFSDIQS